MNGAGPVMIWAGAVKAVAHIKSVTDRPNDSDIGCIAHDKNIKQATSNSNITLQHTATSYSKPLILLRIEYFLHLVQIVPMI